MIEEFSIKLGRKVVFPATVDMYVEDSKPEEITFQVDAKTILRVYENSLSARNVRTLVSEIGWKWEVILALDP